MTRWQTPLLLGFCAGLLGVLSGVSAWAGGAFFNGLATGSFWAAGALAAAALVDAAIVLGAEPKDKPKIEEAW